MFWTAFIWGFGVSCGAACGMILFVGANSAIQLFLKTKAAKKLDAYNELVLASLNRRNEISENAKSELERIAYAVEAIYDVNARQVHK